ncbi:hypothetical protein FEM48_ZijujUnG0052600 [Ziziphus jujuba var. spinosa]|uniref:protein-disulfide reductase n=1 Tax=Ziziphus jujuba var. spinosa TaxID=714518 RepID=A0A978U964_ZIZJJ|nr:hypothetical protein FEM48_ZijujUnG0052600 [Ziziphus jujuba var. spinosa]
METESKRIVVAEDNIAQMTETITDFSFSLLFSAERDFLVRNNNDLVKIDSLKGKKVGLYFSASWRRPCRRFTPNLVEVYNEVVSKGDFEVVFVSTDKDEESFDGYFSEMPWLALPISDSETRDQLDELFKVSGIPYLVIIDENGKVLTDSGVEIIREYGVEGYPFTTERIKELKELKDQEEAAKREQYLKSILVSPSHDFLISPDGRKVNIDSLKGKKVGLYFSASWCGPCRRFTPNLVEVYNEVASKGDFEVVFVSADKDEESFNGYFSEMPWLAIPFSDSETRYKLDVMFRVSEIPYLVIIGENRKLNDSGVEIIEEYGIQGYPFTEERVKELEDQEDAAKREQTLRSILVSHSRDFVISPDGNKVAVSELEGKTIGLYFSDSSYKSCVEFTPKLVEVYEELKAKGENFEIMLIPLDDDEESFEQDFKSMPWFALPIKDKSCEKLDSYFEISVLPTLVIIGPDGKTLTKNGVPAVASYEVLAYPFTPEKFKELLEIEKANEEAQTLESILVLGALNFVIRSDGTEVPVSELVGKNILLYFSAHWSRPCRSFLPKLIKTYHDIKEKDNSFEVIFISGDRDQLSFDEFFSSMPWLALPFSDERKKNLKKIFKIEGIHAAIAIGPSGRTVNMKVRRLIAIYGSDAYPFTEERLKHLDEELEEMAKQ